MQDGEYKLEELVVPTFPSYKRSFVETIGEYLCNRSMFLQLDSKKFRITPVNTRLLNKKRRLSSNGIAIMDYVSRFLEEEVNPEKLGKAEKTLSKGIEDLKTYEVSEISLAALHDLRGHVDLPPLSGIFGGKAPIEGELEEKKPSGYSSFTLSKNDRKKYLSSLRKTLYEAYDDLKEGFKSDENDKQFEILVRSLLSGEDVNLAQVRSINDYVRSVWRDSSITYKLAKYFEESELNGFHKLPMQGKLKILKDVGFKPMHPLIEKIAPHNVKIFAGGFVSGFSGIVGSALVNNYLFGGVVGLGIMTTSMVGSLVLEERSDIIDSDREALREIKYFLHEV